MPCAGVLPSINVALCGAIPRSHMKLMEGRGSGDTGSTSVWRREPLRSPGGGKLLALPILKRAGTDTDTTTLSPATLKLHLSSMSVKENSLNDLEQRRLLNSAAIEAPSWAVPAKGEARLEPVCEAYGTHCSVDLTKKSYYIIGRSPTSHVPLLHRTSSRLHAYFFHHASGAAFVMDCKSAHGTYVNGQLIEPGLPVRVKRGSLVRFGSVGAPCFVLKSFSVEFDRMLNDLDDVADVLKKSDNNNQKSTGRLSFKNEIDSHGVACVKNSDGSGMACITDANDASNAALVLMNTRLNACGGMKALSKCHQKLSNIATMKYSMHQTCGNMESNIHPKRKRRLDEENVSSILNEDNPISSPAFCKRRVRRKVSFDNQKPQLFFPALVTPQELSSDDESTSTTESSC